MQWQVKLKPRTNDVRCRKRFAWFPLWGTSVAYWLEWVWVREHFIENYGEGGGWWDLDHVQKFPFADYQGE